MWAESRRVELEEGVVTIANTKTVVGMDLELMTSHLSVMFRDVTQCRDENTQSFIFDQGFYIKEKILFYFALCYHNSVTNLSIYISL